MYAKIDKTRRQLSRYILLITLLSFVLPALLLGSATHPAAADTLAAGLRGEYFDNGDFTGLKLTRTDATVDFNWGFSSPDSLINSETFSVRWTGQVTAPTSGNYVFVTQSDDGVRLWVGDRLVIDNFTPHPATEDRSAAIALTGGQSYNLRLEYFEITANAIIKLMWVRPAQTSAEVISSANLATPVSPNPAPALASLSPAIIPAGSPDFMLAVSGSGFLQGAIVQLNNSARATSFVSSSRLTAVIQASDLVFASTPKITVVNPLPGGGTSNPLALTVSGGFEADVAPRPTGTNNGTVTIADWTQLGRFSSGLDVAATGNEYQRADCAPRATLGDGRITLTDWVQAGRYATALDPVTAAGGPTAPNNSLNETSENQGTGDPVDPVIKPPQTLRLVFPVIQSQTSIAIFSTAQGDENAFGFSLSFNAERWVLLSATAGDDTRQATFFVNTRQAAEGEVGLVLALPPDQRLRTGRRQIAVLTFRPRFGNIASSLSPVAIEFADRPVAREVVDAGAQSLPASFASVSQLHAYSRLARRASARRPRGR